MSLLLVKTPALLDEHLIQMTSFNRNYFSKGSHTGALTYELGKEDANNSICNMGKATVDIGVHWCEHIFSFLSDKCPVVIQLLGHTVVACSVF